MCPSRKCWSEDIAELNSVQYSKRQHEDIKKMLCEMIRQSNFVILKINSKIEMKFLFYIVPIQFSSEITTPPGYLGPNSHRLVFKTAFTLQTGGLGVGITANSETQQ